MGEVLLHGDLDLWIDKARDLPNMDAITSRARRLFSGCRDCLGPPPSDPIDHPSQHRRRDEEHLRKIITSDPYVKVTIAGATVARTAVIRNVTEPQWDEHFTVLLAHYATHLEFQVKDNDAFGAEVIGTAKILTARIARGELIQDWFEIISPFSNRPPKPDSAIYVRLQFKPFDMNNAYRTGLSDVKGTYFPMRLGGSVTLYQDAHVKDQDFQKTIDLDDRRAYKRERCWEDICQAILEAHHMIYVVGWSVYDKVRLLREPTPGRMWPGLGKNLTLEELERMTLGELLKYKSQEGVRVCLLVWDDRTSNKNLFINTEGVMQTHDEDTRKFFKHSSVNCVLSPRYGSGRLSIFKQRVVGTLFTHHQKCLLVDTYATGNTRKVTAFLGGIDLCDGRYDTPEHRLFSDLNTVFENDFHNPTFPADGKGPRQPWHDLHCKIEGPAVFDVLENFEMRWKKASKPWKLFGKRSTTWLDDALLKLERISWIRSPPKPAADNRDNRDHPSLWVSSEEDPENWHVQVFRSIDSGSLEFPKDVHRAAALNLSWQKNLVVDRSIHTAYVQAIRSAQHFIYIENQYFLGSSYNWPSHRNAGANNLVAMELALKIVNKIRARERFAVYVVIPMWPEGVPTSASVQEILFWQSQTMRMMYKLIRRELNDAGMTSAHPTDYLNFYCLGNREEEQAASQVPQGTDPRTSAQTNRRFMIYVHAKGMIVDDEYVILGSANINQRSLDGSRDTEIAMGAYQPYHSWRVKGRHPRGQVYGYRLSLWEEHLGGLQDIYMHPQELNCVDAVNQIANANWQKYRGLNGTKLQGHLLKYPIKVEEDGTVGALPDCDKFPDVGGNILGSEGTLPNELTT